MKMSNVFHQVYDKIHVLIGNYLRSRYASFRVTRPYIIKVDGHLEVKSTLSSKGSIITISSAFQLETTKNNLFLIFYSLSQTQNGESISDIINYIDKKIKNEEIKIKFYKKLFNIGYNLTETEYDKFRIDKINYYKITDNFPKISSKNLDLRIKEVKYKIDLTFCDSFKVSKKNLEENI